ARPEPAPHPAGIDEAVSVPGGDGKGGQLTGVTDDGEVADLVGDDLLPVGSAARVVGGIRALGDDALQAHLLRGLVEGLPFGFHRLDAANPAAVHGQRSQQLPTTCEREAAQIASLRGEEIEGPEGGRQRAGRRTDPLRALLEQVERGTTLGVLDHHLAIDDEVVRGERAERLDHLRELLGGVTSTSVAETNVLSATLGEDAVTVVLHLEPPALPGEGAGRPAGELEVHVRQAHFPLGDAGPLDREAEGRGRDRPVARRTSAGGHAEGGISTLSWRLARSARGQSPSAW